MLHKVEWRLHVSLHYVVDEKGGKVLIARSLPSFGFIVCDRINN